MGILAKVPEYPQRESTQECRNALGRNQAESAGTPSAGIPPKVPDRPWQQWPPWGFKTAWTPHHPIEVRFVPIGKCVPLCIRVVAKRRHHLEQQFRAPRRLPPIRFKFPVSLPSFYISGFPCFSTSVFQSSFLYIWLPSILNIRRPLVSDIWLPLFLHCRSTSILCFRPPLSLRIQLPLIFCVLPPLILFIRHPIILLSMRPLHYYFSGFL